MAQYKQGDWVNGRHFWDGQFGAPGVVMDPNAAGYMKPVSSEVNKQSDAAQGYDAGTIDAYLATLRGEAVGVDTPSGAGISAANMVGDINLQGIYDQAYKDAGISDLQKQYEDIQSEINAKKQVVADKTNSINENPWGAEATRTGKISKLESYANDSIRVLQEKQANIATQINSAKADVETKLNLATKQVELNQNALSTFNDLLGMGALTNASSDDIAQFARSSGLPISFLQSAIAQSKDTTAETKLIESTDSSGNVTVSLVAIKDGKLEVVGKQSLGAVGKGNTPSNSENTQAIKNQLAMDAAGDPANGIPGVPLQQIFAIYGPYLEPNDIYNLYNANSSYGPAKESLSELAIYGVKDINKDPWNINPAPGQ